jgi:hypothetical protein
MDKRLGAQGKEQLVVCSKDDVTPSGWYMWCLQGWAMDQAKKGNGTQVRGPAGISKSL